MTCRLAPFDVDHEGHPTSYVCVDHLNLFAAPDVALTSCGDRDGLSAPLPARPETVPSSTGLGSPVRPDLGQDETFTSLISPLRK